MATTVASRILGFPRAQPFNFNLLVATAKTSGADLLTQTVVEKKSLGDVDWRRNASFAVFGFLYLGGFQYWLQVTMFKRWFVGVERFTQLSLREKVRDLPGLGVAAKQIFFDCFIHLPFMYYPTFYVVKEAVQGDSPQPDRWVAQGLSKYVGNFVPDQRAMLSVWFPADIVIFSVPLYLRLPTRHVVSFGWTAYLSFLRGA
mmetsp:Transcript_2935/g.9797  ORF Transcript_2935/g.9797 Transcript_2935/m.9797 type:complete len:201 (-) Transcript_2935:205-807(-)|eukprot:CAMPEP_0118894432 /NCGR_PEP_ID=MMETSP1166-20130328/3215_1 /TAXON_ID=1104430 /ORGANISM="Chrysoreinhardia sp, Strain CCMP3193" /LENGTH=200 /DNA_ID=CAMNT_0006833341 /DNA_START=207 /DNA_END=809 /DNA_ORIENTATION=+